MVAAFDAAAISFYRPAVERHPTEAAGGIGMWRDKQPCVERTPRPSRGLTTSDRRVCSLGESVAMSFTERQIFRPVQ